MDLNRNSEFWVASPQLPVPPAYPHWPPPPHCDKAVNTSNSCLPALGEILSLFRFPLPLGLREQNSGKIYVLVERYKRKKTVSFQPVFLPTFVIANFAFFPLAFPAPESTPEETKARTLAPQSINRGLDPGRWEFSPQASKLLGSE